MSESSLDGLPPLEFLDANPVVRYLMGDHPEHSIRARALIESDRPLRISAITIVEIGHVLVRVAGVSRADTVDALIDLLERENIEVHEFSNELAVQALGYCRASGRVNFGDALLWALARAAAPARMWTFDQRFPTLGIDVREP